MYNCAKNFMIFILNFCRNPDEPAGRYNRTAPRSADELDDKPAAAQPLLLQPDRLLPGEAHLGHLRRLLHLHRQLGGNANYFPSM